MNRKITKITKALLFFLIIALSSCETDSIESTTQEQQKVDGKIEYVTIDDVPFLKPNVQRFKSNNLSSPNTFEITSKKDSNSDLDLKHIIEYKGSDDFRSYSIPIKNNSFENGDYYFENLHVIKDGNKYESFIVRYNPTDDSKVFNFKNFTGKMEFFDNKKKLKKTVPFENGLMKLAPQQPPNDNEEEGGGGCTCEKSLISKFFSWVSNTFESIHLTINISISKGDPSNTGYVLVVTSPTTGTSGGTSGSNQTPSGGGAVIIAPNEPKWPESASQFTMADLIAQRLGLDSTDKDWLKKTVNQEITQDIYDYMNDADTFEVRKFALEIIFHMILNPSLKLDISASYKSPFNIDKSAINAVTPEGAKFNSIYDALTKSPEFQKLFVDIFKDSKRNNVKFEIAEHVYEDNNPAKKEVNATTSQDPVTKNIIIKINKQILITGTPKSQTNIENAKTILHESIHAYLFVKAKNPAVGVDIVTTLNTMYPTANEQHDFMYVKMIPVMQKVLGEIRDSVTTTARRAEVEQRTMHPTLIPLTSTPWNWNDYYKYVSLKGLEEASCFKIDFPKESDQWKLLVKYIEHGHDDLQP